MKYALFFLGILLTLSSCRQAPQPAVSLQEDVRILASDSLMGRETGTEGARMAAAYLEERFRQIGLRQNGEITG